jgi:polar amino acid transport system substrate-binding protein
VLLPAFRKAGGVKLTTVVTATGISAGHAGEKHDFAAVATDASAALSDPITDIVVIATRHDTHAEIAGKALRAGKQVFCEKPLAIDAEGLEMVLAAAMDAPGMLTVGFNRRFAPLLVRAKQALEPRSGPLVMVYRVNAGAIPADSWIQRPEGGGRIVGEVCHFVDALTFLTGSMPVKIQAVSARGYGDAVSILARFADGSTGTIVYSSLGDAGVSKEFIEVFASGRVVQLDDFRCLTVTSGGRSKITRAAQDKGQQALVLAFIAAVRGKSAAPIPLDEIAAVTATTFAIEEALRVGGTVAVAALP